MREKQGFGWGAIIGSFVIGGILGVLGILVPIGLADYTSRAAKVEAVPYSTQSQSTTPSQADVIRARGLHMTDIEQTQAIALRLFFMNGGMGGEGDPDAITEAALKRSRKDGQLLGASIFAVMGVDEAKYATEPLRARGSLDEIIERDKLTANEIRRDSKPRR